MPIRIDDNLSNSELLNSFFQCQKKLELSSAQPLILHLNSTGTFLFCIFNNSPGRFKVTSKSCFCFVTYRHNETSTRIIILKILFHYPFKTYPNNKTAN